MTRLFVLTFTVAMCMFWSVGCTAPSASVGVGSPSPIRVDLTPTPTGEASSTEGPVLPATDQ